MPTLNALRFLVLVALAGSASIGASGCATAAGNVGLVAAGGGITGLNSPANEISQVYYLGIFDPQEQIPASFYRITVRGQASFWSNVRFASGWVPSEVVDSLNNRISVDANGTDDPVKALPAGQKEMTGLPTGRRMVAFGPEGMREAPPNHRLVVVMGASPHYFFQAVDQVLGALAKTKNAGADKALPRQLLEAILKAQSEQSDLALLAEGVKRDLAPATPGQAAPGGAGGPTTGPSVVISGGTTSVTSGTTTITGGATTVSATQPAPAPQPSAIPASQPPATRPDGANPPASPTHPAG